MTASDLTPDEIRLIRQRRQRQQRATRQTGSPAWAWTALHVFCGAVGMAGLWTVVDSAGIYALIPVGGAWLAIMLFAGAWRWIASGIIVPFLALAIQHGLIPAPTWVAALPANPLAVVATAVSVSAPPDRIVTGPGGVPLGGAQAPTAAAPTALPPLVPPPARPAPTAVLPAVVNPQMPNVWARPDGSTYTSADVAEAMGTPQPLPPTVAPWPEVSPAEYQAVDGCVYLDGRVLCSSDWTATAWLASAIRYGGMGEPAQAAPTPHPAAAACDGTAFEARADIVRDGQVAGVAVAYGCTQAEANARAVAQAEEAGR